MIRFSNLAKEQVLAHFGVGYDGLSPERAVENRKKYGLNIIREKETKSRARVFFEQFKDLLVIILIFAAILSLFTGEIESTIVIFFVITQMCIRDRKYVLYVRLDGELDQYTVCLLYTSYYV